LDFLYQHLILFIDFSLRLYKNTVVMPFIPALVTNLCVPKIIVVYPFLVKKEAPKSAHGYVASSTSSRWFFRFLIFSMVFGVNTR
jgi:hypothetical protein